MNNTCRLCGRWKPLQSPLCDVCTDKQIAMWQRVHDRIWQIVAILIPLGACLFTWLVAKAVRP